MSNCAICKTSPQIAQHQCLFNIFVIILVIFGGLPPPRASSLPWITPIQVMEFALLRVHSLTCIGAIRLLFPYVQPGYEQPMFNFNWCPVLPGVVLS